MERGLVIFSNVFSNASSASSVSSVSSAPSSLAMSMKRLACSGSSWGLGMGSLIIRKILALYLAVSPFIHCGFDAMPNHVNVVGLIFGEK